MLKPIRIAETALYVNDLDRAARFYIDLFGSDVLLRDERLCALRIAEEEVLLLFSRGGSVDAHEIPGGIIPGHDGTGPQHVCFGIQARDLDAWTQKLGNMGIAIESRVTWPTGAVSLYFRDPDDHAVELGTPGIWG